MANLGLPDSPHKLVFRELVRILRADPTLSAVLRAVLAWEGRPTDSQGLTLAQAPGIRLTPLLGPDAWQYPEAFTGDLFVRVEVLVAGYDVGDLMDLWWAVKRAIYPADFAAKMANINALKDAGAKTGLAVFAVNAADESPESSLQDAIGMIKIAILEQLTT